MSDVTPYFLFLVITYALGSLQFGYHIGELNTPQGVISCQTKGYVSGTLTQGLVDCIEMTDVQYGTVVSMFPIGGLLGSLVAGRLSDRYGRKPISLCNSLIFVAGPLIMATANQIVTLGVGRIICGIASGVSLVTVPIYLNEISPISIRGIVGVMTQLSCVVGILLAQIASVYLSSVPFWRIILAIGAGLGALQFIGLWPTVESPKWLAAQSGQFARAKNIVIRIRGRSDIQAEMKSWKIEDEDQDEEEGEHHGLIRSPDRDLTKAKVSLSVRDFLKTPHYRPAIKAILLIQVAQQFTGTNAVIFYSSSILATLLPDLSAWISVGISVVNFCVTLIAANLIERAGRRTLLLFSLLGMAVSSLLLAYSLNANVKVLSAVAATSIIASFALGLGPIPFLLISEYFEVEALGIAQSFGLSINWITTFCIGFFFPIMRQSIGGSSFYVFSAMAFLECGGMYPSPKVRPWNRFGVTSDRLEDVKCV